MFSSVAFAQEANPIPSTNCQAKFPPEFLIQFRILKVNGKCQLAGENRSTTCTLVQKGNVLTGKFRGEMGDLPLTGTITKDRKMAFTARFGGMSLKFAGTVDGKTIEGYCRSTDGAGAKKLYSYPVVTLSPLG